MTDIWTPITVGNMQLPHRLAMAPMTRSRANRDGTPGDLAPQYYAQRASMGLLITEGTQPSEDGQGYLATPGIFTDAHVAGWQKVTGAVHAAGGRLFIQLMHVGRRSHPENTPHHRQPVAPSAIAPGEQMFTPQGMQPVPEPRALTTSEVKQTIADFARAAERAVEAGADGVEIHGANGYLVHQFNAPNANLRTDEYGGSVENRARFAIEVVRAIADTIGAERTAIRLSPGFPTGGIAEGQDNNDLYRHLAAEFDKIGIAYLHILNAGNDGLLADIRKAFKGTLILNRPGRPREQVGADVARGLADMESLGVMALANPDLVTRLKTAAPFNEVRPQLFYSGGGAEGYTDYPTLDSVGAQQKKILVLGATGGTGRRVIAQAQARGYAVTALVRSREKAGDLKGVNFVVGDARDENTLRAALKGQDAVVSALGTPASPFREVTLLSKATRALVNAMETEHVSRLVVITGIGAGDSRGHGGFLFDNVIYPLLLRNVYADKNRQEAIIKDSGLDWVIVRPSVLNDKAGGAKVRALVDLADFHGGTISRDDVARFVVDQVADGTWIHRSPLITW
jgi:2,4-dienoyl-CoA reductase-like NADH-dependent reductase (Old Yellow Enzyme family)/putative NADH-flavin reductase